MQKINPQFYFISFLLIFYQSSIHAESSSSALFSAPNTVQVSSPYTANLKARQAKSNTAPSTLVSDTPVDSADTIHVNYFQLAIDQALTIDATVSYQTQDGTAKAGKDYSIASGTATIEAGQTSTTIRVNILTDTLVEGAETFFLNITNPIGAKFPNGATTINVQHTIVDNIVTGQFIDDPVEGLTYRCSSSITGITNSNGEYHCNQGDTVTFSLGGTVLGTVAAQTTVITPYSLFPNDFNAGLNIARLLQSIDADNDSSNGKIVIDSNFILPSQTNFSSSGFETVVESALSINLVSAVEAQTQLHSGITSAGGTIPAGVTILTDTTNTGSSGGVTPVIPVASDTTAPSVPTLTTTPTTTNTETTDVEVNGEVNASVFVDNVQVGTISSAGTLTVSLNTQGNNGDINFTISLKDSSANESATLALTITKQLDAPSINSVQTANTSPALSGTLATGSTYSLTVGINSQTYPATNNNDGTWSLAQGTIATLSEGFYSVILTVTDGNNNSVATTLVNKIEINNTGFLIDSAIEGIKYKSGTLNGYTDSDGLFKYEEGQNVTFYIGDETTGIPLGASPTKTDPNNTERKVITLFDLAGSQDENTPEVLNMGKLLQSLDSDKDVSNGITIDERTKESIALLALKDKVDFTVDIDTFSANDDIYNLFNDLADHFGEHRGLLSDEDVKAHLVAIRDNTLATEQASTSEVRGEKEVIKILTGVLKTTAGIVEGVKFRSGNQSGLTNASGVFSYEDGKQVTFSIYQLELGITQGKAIITPADLVISTSFDHPKPRNIIRLLNAFDAISGDSKVTIDGAVREALEIYRSQIDLNLPDGKANTELGIVKGEDEFGAQFEDFEMGTEILNQITTLRAGS